MKIAFIPSTFLPHIGGAEIQTHNIANKLAEKGIGVEVFVLDKINVKNAHYKVSVLKKHLINFVYYLRYYFNINANFLIRNYFKKLVEKGNFTVWHFHSLNFKTAIYTEILNELNQKIILTLQGADIQINKEIGYGYRLDRKYEEMLKKVIPKIKVFHAISNDIIHELKQIGVQKDRILKIPNLSLQKKFEKREKIKNKKFTLLTVGRYAEKKKGFDLVEKIGLELDELLDYNWIIIGRGTKKLLQKDYFKSNNEKFEILEEIKNDEEFFFPNNNLIDYYKKSDLYVNLSRIEGSPLVVLDAISSDLPIISFNTPGVDELVINNVNGQILDEMDFKNFAKKIADFQNFKIDTNSQEYINLKERYDLNKNIFKIINSYK